MDSEDSDKYEEDVESIKSDDSVEILKKKLKIMKAEEDGNLQEVEQEMELEKKQKENDKKKKEEEKRKKEDAKRKKQQEEVKKKEVEEEYEVEDNWEADGDDGDNHNRENEDQNKDFDKLEIQQNSFKSLSSNKSKKSQANNDEDENLAYTFDKQDSLNTSKKLTSDSKSKLTNVKPSNTRPVAVGNKATPVAGKLAPIKSVATPAKKLTEEGNNNKNKPIITPAIGQISKVSGVQNTKPTPSQQKQVTQVRPTSAQQPQNKIENNNNKNIVKTPQIEKKKPIGSGVPGPAVAAGQTAHEIEQARKRKELQEREEKLQKKPRLPDIKVKTLLKVNNFFKKEEQNNKKVDKVDQEKPKKAQIKEELEGDIFGEEIKEKGDQNVAPSQENDGQINPEEEELIKKQLAEKKRKQEILQEQKEKRKHQGEEQDENVKIIMQNYKEKQEELQQKEDELYAIETVDKMKQKKAKQNLKYENEESKWVNPTRQDIIAKEKEEREKDQEKLRLQLINNLKKEEEMIKKRKNEAEAKINTRNENLEKKFAGDIAGKKGTANENKKIEAEQNDIARENEVQREMKKKEHKKYLEHLEIEKKLRRQANKFIEEGQGNLIKGNRALDEINKILEENEAAKKGKVVVKKEKARNISYEEEQKEKEERDQIIIRQLKVQLKQLKDEGKKIKAMMAAQKEIYNANQEYIGKIKNRDGVVVLGDNKFTSFGLVPALEKNKKNKDEEVSTNDEESVATIDKMDDEEKRQVNQVTVIELIINKITEQGFTLSDIFQLLDFNKDGILTIQEIELNIGKLELELTEEEIEEMVKIIDSNKDGVISEFEFVKNLESEYQRQKEYMRAMGDLKDIQNPIVLMERVLDLEVRQKTILKLSQQEQEKVKSKEPEYEKVLSRLKKQEEAHERRQKVRNKGKDLSELTTRCTALKVQLRQLEEEKEKAEIMQKERMEAITENINKLTEQLMNVSESTLKVKQEVDKTQNDYQKLVLKQVAIDRLQEQVNEQRKFKEEERKKQAAKLQSNNKQKVRNMQFEATQKMNIQNTIGATILMQKLFRGWQSRRESKKKKEQILNAVSFIAIYFRRMNKRRKNRKFGETLDKLKKKRMMWAFKLIEIINCYSQQRLAPIQSIFTLKKLLPPERFLVIQQKQNEIKLRQEKSARQQQQQKQINQDIFEEEAKESGLNSNSYSRESESGLPKYQSLSKKATAAQLADQKFILNELPAVITLQREYRKWKKNIAVDSQKGLVFSMGGISPICRFCNAKDVELLCRSCEQCIFCKECFDKFHRSYQRKNHRYYELNPENYSSFDSGSEKNVLEYKEEIFKALGNSLIAMKKKFSYIDQNTGLVTLQEAYDFLEKVPTLQQNNLLEKTKQLVKKFIVSDSEALECFRKQNIDQKYNKNQQYIDHEKFIRGFSIFQEQKDEED